MKKILVRVIITLSLILLLPLSAGDKDNHLNKTQYEINSELLEKVRSKSSGSKYSIKNN